MGTTKTEMKPAARERLLEAVLMELGTPERNRIDLGEALAVSGISRQEFEFEYGDVERCLEAAYEHLTRQLEETVNESCRAARKAGADWPAQVRGGLEGLLARLAANPAFARALVRGYPGLGPSAQARYQAFVGSFAPLLSMGRRWAEAGDELPAEVEALAVGAAEAIIFAEIEVGKAAQLSEFASAILFSLLVPFLGPTRASAEANDRSPGG